MTACEDCPFQDRPVTAATRQWGRVTRALSLALVACASSVLAWQASAEPPDPAPLEQQPKIIRNLFRSSATRYEAIRLLGEEDTDSARALLLQVALAQYGRVGQSYGSSIYLRAIKDQREAAKLLVSDNRGVINRALKTLHGCRLNEDLWKPVEPCLQHASWGPRYAAAYLLRTDTSNELGKEKLAAILGSLDSAWRSLDASELFPSGSNPFLTFRTSFFRVCLLALAEAQPITLETLQEWGQPESTIQRKCLTLARALRRDESAQAAYREVMEHDEDPQLRWVATHLFAGISRRDDLALLQRIESADPYVVKVPEELLQRYGNDWLFEQGGGVRPVRQMARTQISHLIHMKGATPAPSTDPPGYSPSSSSSSSTGGGNDSM